MYSVKILKITSGRTIARKHISYLKLLLAQNKEKPTPYRTKTGIASLKPTTF